jgi:hypothetical protein
MSGQGSMRLWNDVNNGQWAGGVADVHLTGLKTTRTEGETPLGFERLSGRLAGRVHPLGFEVSTQHLAFVSDQGLAWPGGNVTLTWSSVEGGTYQVEASTNLSTWTPVATGVSAELNSTQTSFTENAAALPANNTKRFYKVIRTATAAYDPAYTGQ